MLFDLTTNTLNSAGESTSIEGDVTVPDNLLLGDSAGTSDTYLGLHKRTVKVFAREAYRTLLITYRDMSLAEFESLKADNNNF